MRGSATGRPPTFFRCRSRPRDLGFGSNGEIRSHMLSDNSQLATSVYCVFSFFSMPSFYRLKFGFRDRFLEIENKASLHLARSSCIPHLRSESENGVKYVIFNQGFNLVSTLYFYLTQPQTIGHHKHAAERHCTRSQHWIQISEGGCRDQHHVVEKCPEQVLFDRTKCLA